MPSVTEVITELHAALDSSSNERQLLDFIDQHLFPLRVRYREHRDEFTDDVILFLKSLVSVQGTLREFIEATEDEEWVRTRDDAEELATRFGELRDRLSPHFVAKRADKEIREMIAKAQSLPFAAVASGEADFLRRAARLQSKAQPCPKCGSKMVLRESQHGYFWGCNRFPACFGKRWLSAEESECL
jgi:hypothetical protein